MGIVPHTFITPGSLALALGTLALTNYLTTELWEERWFAKVPFSQISLDGYPLIHCLKKLQPIYFQN